MVSGPAHLGDHPQGGTPGQEKCIIYNMFRKKLVGKRKYRRWRNQNTHNWVDTQREQTQTPIRCFHREGDEHPSKSVPVKWCRWFPELIREKGFCGVLEGDATEEATARENQVSMF
jgi:hypothetical protein